MAVIILVPPLAPATARTRPCKKSTLNPAAKHSLYVTVMTALMLDAMTDALSGKNSKRDNDTRFSTPVFFCIPIHLGAQMN